MTTGPEPTGWELLRGLKDVRESLDKLADGVVHQSLFTTLVTRVTAIEKEQTDARKTRTQQWFTIGLSLLGITGATIANIVLSLITNNP